MSGSILLLFECFQYEQFAVGLCLVLRARASIIIAVRYFASFFFLSVSPFYHFFSTV